MPSDFGQLNPALRRLNVLTYLVIWLGALSLLLIPGAPAQIVLGFCLIIAPTLYMHFPSGTKSFYRTCWHVITILFIVVTLLDWHYNHRPLRQTLVAQMCFFQIYKTYNVKNYSDYLQMILFAVLMVVFCGLVSSSILFLVVLVPFVAVLTELFQVLNLCRSYLSSQRRRTYRGNVSAVPSPAFQVETDELLPGNLRLPRGGLTVQLVCVFGFAAALFFLLPREHVYSPSHFAGGIVPGGRNPVVSGLSAGITLRHFNAIKADSRQVLTVTFPAKMPPRESTYLRAGALEKLENFEWTGAAIHTGVQEPDENGVFWIEPVEPSELPLLIPHIVEYLGASRQVPVALPGLAAVDQVEMKVPERRTGVFARLSFLRKYRAFSWGLEKPAGRAVEPEREIVLSHAVNLPEELETQDIYMLASEISYGFVGNLERAHAIEQYLRSRYSYSLDIEHLNGPATGPNPIEIFLFRHKRANCEVFASAMVVLCRNIRIPARIAIGYYGGVPGDASNVLVFRNQDAHAWVEVWSPERGWVTFDPTPPPPMEVYSGRFSFKRLRDWFDAAVSKWNETVVWYDDDAKNRWMSFLWEPVDRWLVESKIDTAFLGRAFRRIRGNIGRPQVMVLLAGLVAFNVAAAALYLEMRRRLRRRHRLMLRERVDPWFRFYRSLVNVLGGSIESRLPAQTPAEFLVALGRSHFRDAGPLEPALQLYHKGRFGDLQWTEQTESEAERILTRLSRINSG